MLISISVIDYENRTQRATNRLSSHSSRLYLNRIFFSFFSCVYISIYIVGEKVIINLLRCYRVYDNTSDHRAYLKDTKILTKGGKKTYSTAEI